MVQTDFQFSTRVIAAGLEHQQWNIVVYYCTLKHTYSTCIFLLYSIYIYWFCLVYILGAKSFIQTLKIKLIYGNIVNQMIIVYKISFCFCYSNELFVAILLTKIKYNNLWFINWTRWVVHSASYILEIFINKNGWTRNYETPFVGGVVIFEHL